MPAIERAHVGVVTCVVLVDHRAQPPVVMLMRGLPGLVAAQPRVGLRHLGQPAENEVSLDRHGLLAPQGAVVVEDRYPLLGWHAIGLRSPDELQHSPFCRAVVPAVQFSAHAQPPIL